MQAYRCIVIFTLCGLLVGSAEAQPRGEPLFTEDEVAALREAAEKYEQPRTYRADRYEPPRPKPEPAEEDGWLSLEGLAGGLAGQLVLVGLFFVFLAPPIVAHRRKHHHTAAILVLTLVSPLTLGIAWIAALVWALALEDRSEKD